MCQNHTAVHLKLTQCYMSSLLFNLKKTRDSDSSSSIFYYVCIINM